MKKKIFTVALSTCLLFVSVATMANTAYAGEAETTGQESLPAAVFHDCGYKKPQGIRVTPIEDVDTPRTNKAVAFVATPQSLAQPISGASRDNTERIGKNFLQNQANATSLVYAYEQLAEAIDCRANTVEFTWNSETGNGITFDEVDMVYNLVREDYPEFFWWGHDSYIYSTEDDIVVELILAGEAEGDEGILTANIYLYDTYAEIIADNAKFNAKVQKIVADAPETISAYEKELFVHDWIALNNTYDDDDTALHNHVAYGAIMTGTAVCEGYTRAMQLLLNEMDIENYTVSGTSKGVGHTWNVIKLDDGSWYQTDVTWDDQGDRESDIFYAYFNITTEQMKKDHAIPDATDENLPNYILFECNATEYWYYNQNPDCVVAVGADIDEADFIEKLEKQFKENIIYARIYAIGDNSTEEALGKLFNESSAKKILGSRDYEGTYIPGYSSMGEIEYHFGLQYESDIYGYLEQGKVNTNAVTIRFYPYGTEDSVIEEKILLPVGKGENEDDLCVKEVADTDIDEKWEDCNDYVNKKYYGTYRKDFSARLLAGEYVMAVNIEGQGCYSSYIFVGKEAKTQDVAIENRWLFYELGDLDDNNIVDASDALFLTRYIAEWDSYLKNGNWCAADINDDGIINIVDLTILQRHLAGWKDYENLEDYENGSKVAADLENAG